MSEREKVSPLTREEFRDLTSHSYKYGLSQERITRLETTIEHGWADEARVEDSRPLLQLARTATFDLLRYSPSEATRLELIKGVFEGRIY